MISNHKHIGVLLFNVFLFGFTSIGVYAQREVLAHWRFEQVKHLNDDALSIAAVGQPLTATDRGLKPITLTTEGISLPSKR